MEVFEWIRAHEAAVWWLVVLSVATFVGTLIAVPVLVVRIPSDYFVHRKRHPANWRSQHPILRFATLALKNVTGIVFIIVGLAMFVLPGQGILTLLIGIVLLDFPGKFALEQWLIRKRLVAKSVNWIRAKANRPPLEIPRHSVRNET
jgi:archaellum biogenesis protein FlaJ (TadC family)